MWTPEESTSLVQNGVVAPYIVVAPDTVAVGLVGYQELERIGAGGFGEVFKAWAQTNTGKRRPFALKRTLPYADPAVNIEEFIENQQSRLDSLRREAGVYFSPTFNTRGSRCQSIHPKSLRQPEIMVGKEVM